MSEPRVSVVVPTYRRPELLCRAVDSVLRQSFVETEVIVVDDNGLGHPMQEATQQALQASFDDPRLHYIANEQGVGGGEARNVGIRAARGEYIAFLDDDEDWLPEKLAEQVRLLDQAQSEVGVVDTGFYDLKPGRKARKALPKMQGWIFERLLRRTGGRAPKLSTLLCRKSALEAVGLFDPELPARQDYDLFVRLAREYRFESVMKPLAYKRHDADHRIGGNPDNRVRGYELTLRKLATDLEKRPKYKALYLLKYAEALVNAGRIREARSSYCQAFTLWPWNPRLIPYGFRVLSGRPRKD